MIYTLGFLVMLAARSVYAGMKQHELFYKPATDYEVRYKNVKKGEPIFSTERRFSTMSQVLFFFGRLLFPQ